MELQGRVLVDDGVAGVVAALVTHHQVHVVGQEIGDLPFAFVSELGPQ